MKIYLPASGSSVSSRRRSEKISELIHNFLGNYGLVHFESSESVWWVDLGGDNRLVAEWERGYVEIYKAKEDLKLPLTEGQEEELDSLAREIADLRKPASGVNLTRRLAREQVE